MDFKKIDLKRIDFKKLFLNVTIPAILTFTTLIGTAVSYQQARTETSRNVYTLGDIDISFHSGLENLSHKKVYPGYLISSVPEIKNEGENPAWIILAVKIPSEKAPFSSFFHRGADNVNSVKAYNTENSDDVYYSSFSTYITSTIRSATSNPKSINYKNDGKMRNANGNFGNASAIYEDMFIDGIFDANGLNGLDASGTPMQSGSLIKDDYYTKWKKIGINSDYANQENGFFIYYFGSTEPLGSYQKSQIPFNGFIVNNFQTVTYDKYFANNAAEIDSNNNPSSSNRALVQYEVPNLDKDLGIEIKLMAIQSGLGGNEDEETIETAWNAFKGNANYTSFGKEAIIHTQTEKQYIQGYYNVNCVVTKDVRKILVKNETTEASDVFNITPIADSNGFAEAVLNVNFRDSGLYSISVYTDDNTAINTVSLGQITVTEAP